MIEITDGTWVSPENITLIKTIDKDTCLVFFLGQSALDGHVIDYPAEEVVELVNDYIYGEEEPEEEDESATDE